MKRRAVVAIAISLGLLAIFIILVGWEDVLASLETASLSIYAVAFVGSLCTLAFRSGVWNRILIVVDEPRPYWLVASVFSTAMFVKYVTPYGQVASGVGNAAIVNRYTEAAYEESLAAVLTADVVTYLPYYTFGFLGLVIVAGGRGLPFELGPYVVPVMIAIAVVLIAFATLSRYRQTVAGWIVRLVVGCRGVVSRFFPSLAERLTKANVEKRLEGFAVTLDLVSRDRRSMGLALLYGHLGWLGLALALYASAAAVGTPLPVGVVLLSVAVSKVGFVIPTPGGIGGVEAALASAIFLLAPSAAGVSVATATAIAILYRFATYWFTVAIGGTTSVALTVTDPLPPE